MKYRGQSSLKSISSKFHVFIQNRNLKQHRFRQFNFFNLELEKEIFQDLLPESS